MLDYNALDNDFSKEKGMIMLVLNAIFVVCMQVTYSSCTDSLGRGVFY